MNEKKTKGHWTKGKHRNTPVASDGEIASMIDQLASRRLITETARKLKVARKTIYKWRHGITPNAGYVVAMRRVLKKSEAE